MKITKDESAILAAALSDAKYAFAELASNGEKEKALKAIDSLEKLEEKLTEYSFDARRCGRRSKTEFKDLLSRVILRYGG